MTAYCDSVSLQPIMDYIVGQRELCPTTQRQHWQCYFHLQEAKSLSAVRKALPADWNSPHLIPAKGSFEKNYIYCTKEQSAIPGTRFEHGIKPHQGKSSALLLACQQVKEGGLRAVSDDGVLVRHHRGLATLAAIRRVRQPFKPKNVIWYWGPTGSGKSRAAHEYPDLYVQSSSSGWFDGYYGQKTILLEDYDGSLPLREFLQLTDGYDTDAKVKGGFAPIHAETILVTSHFHPYYYFDSGRWPEVHRRICKIIRCERASITSLTSVKNPFEINLIPGNDNHGSNDEETQICHPQADLQEAPHPVQEASATGSCLDGRT